MNQPTCRDRVMTQATDWDLNYDVVVVGSGAGGMTAALIASDLGLNTLVIEKSALIGGTTAVSGGAVWIPDNLHMQAVGYPDSIDEALTYLKETIGEEYDEEKCRAYLETGPDLVRYLEEHTKIAFRAGPLPDYYSDRAGGKDKYRALDPLPLSARELGADIDVLRPPHPQTTVAGVTFTTGEVATILRKDAGWLLLTMRLMLRHFLDIAWRVKSRKAPRMTLGNALAARCLISLRERGIPVWRETAFRELIKDETGVVGIVAERGGKQLRIEAAGGVILAAGGFGSNREMRSTHLIRSPRVERSVAPEVNNGDAIAAGMRVGADTDLMDEAWWIPVYRLQRSGLTCGMFFDRAFPGSMIVNQRGERFMNDASNYDETGRIMANVAPEGQPDTPSFYIFDARYRRKYIAGPLQPSPVFCDRFLSKEVRDILVKANSLHELAEKLGIDPAVFTNTVARFNDNALRGTDPDFHRGEETYERHYSDPRVSPNSTMGQISAAPFYAIAIYPGDIGTRGGLVTDKNARVKDINGNPIPGLYAAGNSAATVMGRTYPAGGVTIGAAMVFGARAAMHVAGKPLPE